MNTPFSPVPPTPTPGPSDPTTPGSTPRATALGQAALTAAAGTPLAIVTVWLLETYGTVHGKPLTLDAESATAIGAVGAALIGYIAQVVNGLIQMLQERLTRP